MGMYRYTVFVEKYSGSHDDSNYSRKDEAVKRARHIFRGKELVDMRTRILKENKLADRREREDYIERVGVMDEKTQHIVWENGFFMDENGWAIKPSFEKPPYRTQKQRKRQINKFYEQG